MKPIFDGDGKLCGWLRDNIVYDLDVEVRAFLSGEAVFTFDCDYLGTFHNGFFRDQYGDAVAFVRGAKGGPLTPLPELPPIPPLPPLPPLRPLAPLPPLPPLPRLSWSRLEWEEFLEG
jgi:hypothetical protein